MALVTGIAIARPEILGYEVAKLIHTLLVPVLGAALLFAHIYAALLMLMAKRQGVAKWVVGAQLAVITILVVALYMALTVPIGQPTNVTILQVSEATSTVNRGNASADIGPRLLTIEEVSRHNKPGDCWIVVNGRVYDVTNYIPRHPAGPEWIIRYCGRDATAAFAKYHSAKAWRLLESFYIGDLANATSIGKIGEGIGPIRGYAYDDDDEHEEEEDEYEEDED